MLHRFLTPIRFVPAIQGIIKILILLIAEIVAWLLLVPVPLKVLPGTVVIGGPSRSIPGGLFQPTLKAFSCPVAHLLDLITPAPRTTQKVLAHTRAR